MNLDWRFVLTILYSLFMIWTGLLRSIEAQAFKPNAFFFCMTIGLVSIVSGFLFRSEKRWPGIILSSIAAGTALAFYLNCLIVQPEKDATIRVALAIVASIGQCCLIASAIIRPQEHQHCSQTNNLPNNSTNA